MALVTDMNERERRRFAETLDKIAEQATKAAAAFRARDDTEAAVSLAIVVITVHAIGQDFGEIVKSAVGIDTK